MTAETTASLPAGAVLCTRCHGPAFVPFTPTPGRPVYCRACFVKRQEAAETRIANGPPRSRLPPAQRMLSYRRKGHFVHDALAELGKGTMDEGQRRAFVEMVFTRGARQTTRAALDYLHEKTTDETLGAREGEALARLVERYSERR